MNFSKLDKSEQSYVNSFFKHFDINFSKEAKTYLLDFVTDTRELEVALAFIEAYAKLMLMDITEPEQINEILNYKFKQSEISHNVQSVIKHKGEVMAKISRDEVLELTIKGLNKAQQNYLKWTKDTEGVSQGAEYVLTTYIAESIGTSEDIGSLYVEEAINTLFEQYDKTLENKDKCRGDGRADIAIYLKNKLPLAIIEVKNNVNTLKKVDLDITRIECLIDEQIIEYGVVAFISEFEDENLAHTDIEKYTVDLIRKSNSKGLKYKYLTEMFEPSKSYDDKFWAWSSIAILFYK